MPCEYVKGYYKVPACIGRRVIVNGKPGIIAEDLGYHIGVNFDEDKPGVVFSAHPTWRVEYLGMGTVRKMTRSQARYQRFLRDEFWDGSFIDWCRWEDATIYRHRNIAGIGDPIWNARTSTKA